MAFTTSDKMKMVIFQDEVNGVLTDLMARSHVDNVIYEEGGQQKALSTKLAEIIAAVALKADSTTVTADIKAANDALYNKIMGITAEDGATVNEAYDTLKEVAEYLTAHGDVVQGFTTDIAGLKTAVEALQSGMTKVEHSDTNGNVKVDGAEVVVYQHPATHPARTPPRQHDYRHRRKGDDDRDGAAEAGRHCRGRFRYRFRHGYGCRRDRRSHPDD